MKFKELLDATNEATWVVSPMEGKPNPKKWVNTEVKAKDKLEAMKMGAKQMGMKPLDVSATKKFIGESMDEGSPIDSLKKMAGKKLYQKEYEAALELLSSGEVKNVADAAKRFQHVDTRTLQDMMELEEGWKTNKNTYFMGQEADLVHTHDSWYSIAKINDSWVVSNPDDEEVGKFKSLKLAKVEVSNLTEEFDLIELWADEGYSLDYSPSNDSITLQNKKGVNISLSKLVPRLPTAKGVDTIKGAVRSGYKLGGAAGLLKKLNAVSQYRFENLLDESDKIDEAKKLGSKVMVTKGKDKGKIGYVRQINKGSYGRPGDKSLDLDLEGGGELVVDASDTKELPKDIVESDEAPSKSTFKDLIKEKIEKIACLECDVVSTKKAWEKNNGSCPACNNSTKGVSESEEINEAAKFDAKTLVKIMKNTSDWGDAGDYVSTKGKNVVVIDTFFYGGDKALTRLENDWTSPRGSYAKYFKEKYNVEFTTVDTFMQINAEGKYRKITKDGIVGVELSIKVNNSKIRKEIEDHQSKKSEEDWWDLDKEPKYKVKRQQARHDYDVGDDMNEEYKTLSPDEFLKAAKPLKDMTDQELLDHIKLMKGRKGIGSGNRNKMMKDEMKKRGLRESIEESPKPTTFKDFLTEGKE